MPQTSQQFIPIQEIRDGVLILKNGEMRSVLICSSINFDLKSEDEQTAIISQYQSFLNSLDFPLQIFVQSRKFNVIPYLGTLEERLKGEINELIRVQITEYIQFIKSFTESTNIMSKEFFAVVPYTPSVFTGKKGGLAALIGKKNTGTTADSKANMEQFEENRSQLEQRESVVVQGLSRLGIRTLKLGTEELVELFYKLFNPGEHTAPRVQNQ